jgi:hypothetical protein
VRSKPPSLASSLGTHSDSPMPLSRTLTLCKPPFLSDLLLSQF